MCGTDHGPVRRLVDHERALRDEAFRLLTSPGSLRRMLRASRGKARR